MTKLERIIICTALSALMSMIAWMIFWPRAAGAATVCQATPLNKTGHWMWRDIEGRRCWFEGGKLLPKSELIWKDEPARTEQEPEHQSPDSSVRSGPRIETVRPRALTTPMTPKSLSERPIDLMQPGELHGPDGVGNVLIIPRYNYSNPQ